MISVIVPIYKVEKYLDRCVNSLINQSYKELEIILVDDGSPDNCPLMCDEWKERDNRIKVIHKENGGLSDARNAGLEIASGEYIGFVDSDDFVTPDMYELLMKSCLENDSDIAVCGVRMVWENGHSQETWTNSENCILNNHEAMQALLEENILKQPVWNRLYRRKSIEGILFPKGKYHEDVYWSYQVIAKANKVSVIDIPCYYYLQRENSIMGTSFSLKRLDALQGYKERLIYLKQNYPDLVQKERTRNYFFCMYLMQAALREKCDEAYPIIKTYADYFGKGDMAVEKITHKIWIALSKISFKITCQLRNYLKIGL